MSALEKLPQYQCHKKVRAAKVIALTVTRDNETDAIVHVQMVLDAGPPAGMVLWEPPLDWYGRHSHRLGNYVVVYEDGYVSVSPGDAFESGYALLPAA